MKYLIIFLVILPILVKINAHKSNCNNNNCNSPCHQAENGTAVDNPAKCNSFFLCIDGSPVPNSCPPGQYFNPETNFCDDEYECVSDDDFQCPSQHGVYFLASPNSCEEYVLCFGGFPIFRTCAGGLHFNARYGFCDFPSRAECILNICPDYNDPFDLVFIPSEVDCEKYFLCFDGETVLLRCAPGLHFDPETTTCVQPELTNCTIDMNTPEPPTEPDSYEIECPSDNGIQFVPHPKSCEHFFICTNGVPVLVPCAPNTQFDPISEWCDFKENVNCTLDDRDDSSSSSESGDSGSSEEPTNTPRPIPEPHEIDCPSDTGFFCIRHPYSCEFFFMCKNGVSILVPCAYGQYFNPHTLWCENSDNVRCHLDHSSEEDDINPEVPPTTEPGPDPQEIDCPTDPWFSMENHPESCYYFFVCIEGESIMRPCAPGLIFDHVNRWCDTPENAVCHLDRDDSSSSSDDSSAEDDSSSGSDKSDSSSGSDKSDSGSDKSDSTSGSDEEDKSEDGSDSSSDKSGGDSESSSGSDKSGESSSDSSDSSSSEETSTPRPIPEPHEIDCPSDTGFFCIRHPYSCEFFFMCKNGVSILVPCAYGQYFNPHTLWCENSDNVRCHLDHSSEEDDINPEVPPTTEPGPDPQEIDCPTDPWFSMENHPESCYYFFVCIEGESIMRPCAPGLIFDDVNRWCDVPEKARCHLDESEEDDTTTPESCGEGPCPTSPPGDGITTPGDDTTTPESCGDGPCPTSPPGDDATTEDTTTESSPADSTTPEGTDTTTEASDTSSTADDTTTTEGTDTTTESSDTTTPESCGDAPCGTSPPGNDTTTSGPDTTTPESCGDGPCPTSPPGDDTTTSGPDTTTPESCGDVPCGTSPPGNETTTSGPDTTTPESCGDAPCGTSPPGKDTTTSGPDTTTPESCGDAPCGTSPPGNDTTTPAPAPEPHEVECPEEGVHVFLHPNSCSHYFVCSNGQSVLQECAPGLYFDVIHKWCDFPENVDCYHNGTDIGSDEEDEAIDTNCPLPHRMDCPSSDNLHFFNHPYTCDCFFICSAGENVLMECAPHLAFDIASNWCTFPDTFNCPSEGNMSPPDISNPYER